MPQSHPRATIRVALENAPGMLSALTTAIDEAGGQVLAVDLVRAQRHIMVRDLAISAPDDETVDEIAATLDALDGVELLSMSDDVIDAHIGGKIEIHNKREVNDREDLSLVYTPGVARVCRMIAEEPHQAYRLTIKSNAVAVVTDGTAVLGLGDIGPLAALPVMEGKAMLFKSFADVDAYPILVSETDPDLFVETVARIAQGFGGINLEDIAAPRSFEIEGKLRQRLDIPVFHDDQHGTAVVVLAALLNAARLVGKDLPDLKVVVQGIGAAGVAISNLLIAAGVTDLIPVDRDGIVEPSRKGGMADPIRRRLAKQTNPRGVTGGQIEALDGADVFIGVSGPNSLPVESVKLMADDAIVFALANPTPEIMPEEAGPHVRVMATGRSDYPNQINNVLCFPGLFRGLLDAAATKVTDEMKLAAARAIAEIVGEDLGEEYIIPSPFDRSVAPVVAEAVAATAREQGHIRPGAHGSWRDEHEAHAKEAAREAVKRASERRGFAGPSEDEPTEHEPVLDTPAAGGGPDDDPGGAGPI